MSELAVIATDIKNELAQLQQDFTNAMRTFEGLGSRVTSVQTKVSSFHKQVTNAAAPNPETNATTQSATTPVTPTA